MIASANPLMIVEYSGEDFSEFNEVLRTTLSNTFLEGLPSKVHATIFFIDLNQGLLGTKL